MRGVLLLPFVLCSTLAVAKEDSRSSFDEGKSVVIQCTSKSKPDVTVTLNAERKFKRVLSCIRGEFAADMTPCAPNGGYGLSYPTGTASLARVVDRWQDYGDHLGGITGHKADATRIEFDGGYFSPGDGTTRSGWSDHWTFTVNRLTGEGTLTEQDKPDTSYSCSKASAKF